MEISIANKLRQTICLALFNLVLFGCATTAPPSASAPSDSSQESSNRTPSNEGQRETLEDEEDIPLGSCISLWTNEAKTISEIMEKERTIRFSETIECDDGTILPLGCSKPIELSRRKWSDRQAAEMQKKRACDFAKWHQSELRETVEEVTVLNAIHKSLLAMRDSLKKAKKETNWKPAKKDLAALITDIAKLEDMRDVLAEAGENPRAKRYRIIEKRIAFVLEFTQYTLEVLENKKVNKGLHNALNANIQLIQDALTDVLVDYRSQKRREIKDRSLQENLNKN
jgi:hypothetical protein